MTILAKLILLIFCTVPIYSIQTPSDPIVQLPNGKIRGLNHGSYFSFESIPYAEPPIGENRFEPPKPFTGNWSDIRDATKSPPKCMQWDQYLFKEDLLDGQEDCLTINIYTPSIGGNKKYPVVVLIHGGAFMFGTADQSGHDYLMKRQDTVVVKMNYRLGPLGFLSTGDDVISGNFGLKDQLLALEWTKANVAAFNGDPESITAFGFSAGAASVHLQMMNKNFEKIAKRAVSLSGTSFCDWVIMKNPARRAIALAKHLDCPTETSSSIKLCLKKKKAADIVRAVSKLQNIGYNPAIVFGPVIESKTVSNAFLSEHPENIIKSGKSAQIPWLASYSKDDGGYNAAELMQQDSNGKEMIEILNDRWNELAPVNLFFENSVDENQLDAYSNSLREKYLGNKRFSAENYKLVQNMYTDLLFANGVRNAWKLHKQYTNSPVYAYVFDSPAPLGIGQMISRRFDISFGTVHGDDFFLMFKSPVPVPFSKTQVVQSETFLNMVGEFNANGTLQFADCKFRENNANTNGFYVMEIKPNSCETSNFENML
ncbi:esterase-5B-like [Episyrphus balteatus]|uniref:esterase-5B-like n=1 Tax=Episyrphus balteatus TaxID=286459 RepID=UPI0024858FC3|nr:esterase-5B-like [Episyrphus balteatus]